jgi:hypothetical protein
VSGALLAAGLALVGGVRAGDLALPPELVAAHSYPLVLADGEWSGAGAEQLLAGCRAAEFVALGEQHGLAEVPRIAARLFVDLRERGFDHVALENGKYAMQLASAIPATAAPTEWRELALRRPMSIAFASREELDLLAEVRRCAADVEAPLWGLDQVAGAAMLLERLAATAPDAPSRRMATALAAEVAAREDLRFAEGAQRASWLASPAAAEALDQLAAALGEALPEDEAERLEALRFSADLYRSTREGMRGEGGPYGFNRRREDHLRRQFLEHLAVRERRGGRPRVLVKAGAAHLSRTVNEVEAASLGSLLAALAEQRGGASFHVALLGHGPPGHPQRLVDRFPEVAGLAAAADPDGWTVVDLRPLRDAGFSGGRAPSGSLSRRLLFGYDVVVFLGGCSPASAPVR